MCKYLFLVHIIQHYNNLYLSGPTVHHSCGICADRFSLSAALLLHKIQCHSWNSNGQPTNFDTFLADLITQETKHSSDEDFNYTFVITTSITQIAKECIVKAEPFTEIPPDDNMDLVVMEISDPVLLQPESAELVQPEDELPIQCKVVNTHRTLCPLCGKEKSSRNMRRHMKLIHKVDIDPKLEASKKAKMKRSKYQFSNDDESFEQLPDNFGAQDPLNASDFVLSQVENTTNVEPEETLSSSIHIDLIKSEAIEIIPQKTKITEVNPLKCHLCNKVLKSSRARHMQSVHGRKKVPEPGILSPNGVLKATHESCPLCERLITSNNFCRHLSIVHKKNKAEIKEIRLNYDDNDVDQGVRSSETTYRRNKAVKSQPFSIERVQSSSEPTETSETDNPMDQLYAQCTLCSKTILRISLKRHFQTIHGLDEFEVLKNLLLIAKKCKICNFSGTVQGLNIHYTKKHSSDKPESESVQQIKQFESQCPLCKKIMNRNNLKRHLQQKHALNGAELSVNLKLSKQNRSPSNLTSKCSLCHYTGSTDVLQRLHFKKNHSKEYATDTSLQQLRPVALLHHIGRSRYTCTLCLKIFTTRSIIMEHFHDTHCDIIADLSDERFDCDLCPQVFSSFDDFKTHQNDHISKTGREKFLCNYCGQYKQSKAALENHIDTHMNLRKFSCDICHKRFNEKRQIMSHMVSHNRKKPFVCSVDGCTAAFPRLANLREHGVLRHTTEKRYECEICGKKFMLKQYLR